LKTLNQLLEHFQSKETETALEIGLHNKTKAIWFLFSRSDLKQTGYICYKHYFVMGGFVLIDIKLQVQFV
jgi:hypothetical protein